MRVVKLLGKTAGDMRALHDEHWVLQKRLKGAIKRGDDSEIVRLCEEQMAIRKKIGAITSLFRESDECTVTFHEGHGVLLVESLAEYSDRMTNGMGTLGEHP